MIDTLLPFPFDFKNPDYTEVFEWRLERLKRIRENPLCLEDLKTYYKNHTAQFITDWGITDDPRNASKGLPSLIPFILMPIQIDWIYEFEECWRKGEPLITEKSREMGMSCLAVAVADTHCLFREGVSIGFGSRKQEYVDSIGKPNSLLFKVRQFLNTLPREFRGGWEEKRHSALMKVTFPETGSIITGEAGDNIGRGDRKSYYHVDESAWLERAEKVDASLSQTTNCRSDISTPHGKNNSFARRRHSGKIKVFRMHWRSDPRKSEEWYAKMCRQIDDKVIIAQELDIDYSASVTGVVIPSAWVEAAVDAHVKLGIEIRGARRASLDIADEGKDKNAFCGGHGILIEFLEEWTGKESDIYETVERAANLCDEHNYYSIKFDTDGLGAGARGDARNVNQKRSELGIPVIDFIPYRGSGEVQDKEEEVFPAKPTENGDFYKGRTNGDYYQNAKAQAWGDARRRFRNTYKAVMEGQPYDPDEIISISSIINDLDKLKNELSQPTWEVNNRGLLVVNKTPDTNPSPNYADSCIMYFARTQTESVGIMDVY